MTNFHEMSKDDIKDWLSDNNVLFLTNSVCYPGGTFLSSIRSYCDWIPVHNFAIARGLRDNLKPHYGIDVFLEMVADTYSSKAFRSFDYIVYIDDDAFICDFPALCHELEIFIKENKYCLAGVQDGGVICHRNHSRLMVNTFLSFWNMKALRKSVDAQGFITVINQINHEKRQQVFFNKVLEETHPGLYDKMCSLAAERINEVSDWRHLKFTNGESPYCDTVRNDKNNPVEPEQVPYTFKDYDKEEPNFEPYYIVEQAFVAATGLPIYYFFGTDFYDASYSDEDVDNSGISSAIMTSNSGEKHMICVHTWFSRAYTKWPANDLQMNHTVRINKMIATFGSI